MSTEKIVMNALFGKTELKSTKVELADLASFQKAVESAETSLDAVTPAKTKAKDGLLGYKIKAGDAMRAYDAVLTQHAELQKLAKQLGLELPTNAKSAVDRAKVQYGMAKARYNNADKLIAGLAD
jgi:hypothetical protein